MTGRYLHLPRSGEQSTDGGGNRNGEGCVPYPEKVRCEGGVRGGQACDDADGGSDHHFDFHRLSMMPEYVAGEQAFLRARCGCGLGDLSSALGRAWLLGLLAAAQRAARNAGLV